MIASPSRCTCTRMPSSLVSTTAGNPVLATAPATSGALAASIGRTGCPTASVTAVSPSSPDAASTRAAAAVEPSSIAARCTALAGTPNASARPSCTRESSAPCRISSNTRPRSRRCSGSVARANNASTAAERSAADPAPPRAAISSNAASTSVTVSVGLGGRCGQRSQRRPAHPGPALPQRAGQVGHDQRDLGGVRLVGRGSGTAVAALAGWRRRSAHVW